MPIDNFRGARLAGFGSRLGAILIDSLILTALVMVMVIPIAVIAGMSADTSSTTGNEEPPAFLLLGAVLAWLLAMAFWIWNLVFRQGKTGRSVGKQVLGIRVVNEQTGLPPGVGMAFLRGLVRYFFEGGITSGLGYLVALFTEKRQTLHDMMAGCLVVKQP